MSGARLDTVLDASLDARPKGLKQSPREPMGAGKGSRDPTMNPAERSPIRADDEQLALVQQKVSRGEYEINAQRVAIAILERVGVMQNTSVRNREGGHGLMPEMSVPREV